MGRPSPRCRSAREELPPRRRGSVAAAAFAAALAAAASLPRGEAIADDVSPEVTSLRAPLAFRTTLERASEHGCSQSFASSWSRATVTLGIDAAGAATLTADVSASETFGASPHRWADGDREVTHTQELERAVFTGTTTRPNGDSIVARFTRVERASVRFTGYGTLPLPPATATTIDATLRCALARTGVLPAAPSVDEEASAVVLLRCTFDAAPDPVARLEPDALPFGRGPGVVARVERRMWDHETSRTVRRSP